jgi:hypothetical protein
LGEEGGVMAKKKSKARIKVSVDEYKLVMAAEQLFRTMELASKAGLDMLDAVKKRIEITD